MSAGFGEDGGDRGARRRARRMLGMTLVVTDPHKRVAAGVEQVPLVDLMTRADFVFCLAVASPETENLVGAAALARMKPDAVFINVSRGGLVDEVALEAALREGRSAGAALDVGRAPDEMPSPTLAALRTCWQRRISAD